MAGSSLGTVMLMAVGAAAVALAIALTGLIGRRAWQERLATAAGSRAATFRTALMRHLVDPAPETLDPWRSDPVALDIVAHVLQLLRGGQRQSLMDLVDTLDLLRPIHARLRSKRPLQRIAAVRMLGNFHCDAVITILIERLNDDRALEVRLEAGLALARLGALPQPSDVFAALSDNTYASPAHRLILRAVAQQYPETFVALWAAEKDGPARLAIADGLGELVTSDALAALAEAVQSDDVQLRCEALRAFRRLGHPAAVPRVLASLDDPEWIVRVQAASAAGTLRIDRARPRLEALTHDPHWWVRYRAGQALLRFETKAAA